MIIKDNSCVIIGRKQESIMPIFNKVAKEKNTEIISHNIELKNYAILLLNGHWHSLVAIQGVRSQWSGL